MTTDIENLKIYSAACAHIRALTPARFYLLHKKFPDIEAVWKATVHDMAHAGIERDAAEKIVEERKTIDPERCYSTIVGMGIGVVCSDDDAYPALLKEISPPPYALFYRGTLPPAASEHIGVVGTRNVTHYGATVTPGIISDLVQSGFGIVSGLARGVDTIAHTVCLERGGITLAVLGTGVDDQSIYPPQNRLLARQIIDHGGCVISEYIPGTRVQAYHFPARNRIISGISRGVVIIEAAMRSGALITARHALDQNRDVFAVPGPITNPMSAGPHSLIKQGAIPLTSSADIFDHYNRDFLESGQQRMLIGHNAQEDTLLKILSPNPLTIDELCRMCDLDTRVVASTLMVMEMKRMVRSVGGTSYIIAT